MNARETLGIRVPPHNMEAEQSVLGACLLAPAVIDDCREILAETDWYLSEHRMIWRALCSLADEGTPVDLLTVRQKLKDMGASGRAVDLPYIAELSESTPGSSNATAYARIVREHAERREIIVAANRAADIAFNEADGASRALAEFSNIGGERKASSVQSIKDVARSWVETLDERVRGEQLGLRFGVRDLDARWGGLRGGNLCVIAGRPKMGKTTLAMGLAENASAQGQVLVFSAEMSSAELMDRMASRFSRIPLRAIRDGDLSSDDWPRVTTAMAQIAGLVMHIDETASPHISDVRAKARALHRRSPVSLVVIDYLQLLRGDGDNRTLEVADITRQSKALAKELDCPVVLLSQLSRKCEERKDKRPMPSDLRDSGAIEQDADYVVFTYRHEMYEENTPRKGVMEVITSLGRMVEPGTDYLLTDLAHSTLNDTPDGWTLPPEYVAQPRRFDGKDL